MRETMLILHFIGLAMGLGTGFAHAFIGAAAAKLPANEAIKFKLQTQILGRMGNIGLILLVVSGIYLLVPYWNALLSSPLLMLKLLLVIVLIVFITIINRLGKKAAIKNPETQFRKMELLGKMTLVTTITIVIVAVIVFR